MEWGDRWESNLVLAKDFLSSVDIIVISDDSRLQISDEELTETLVVSTILEHIQTLS